MKKYKFLLILAGLCLAGSMQAQNKVDAKVQVKSMHYWRGLRVTSGMMTGASVGYFGDNFSAYAWGGLSFDGSYTEVTNVISYKVGNFKATLLDIYNFSNASEIKYFNYKQGESGHLVDLTLAYSLPFMSISWSTLFHGNDLTPVISDDLDEKGDQRLSTYVQLQVPIKLNDITLTPYIAPAFALNGDAERTLYGDEKFGIANVGFMVSKTLKYKELEFPLSGTLGYNAMLDQASIQLAISLF